MTEEMEGLKSERGRGERIMKVKSGGVRDL